MAMNESIPIPEFIINAMQIAMNRAVDQELEKAKENIEKRKEEIYAGAILQAEKFISAQRIGETIRIEIKSK